MNEKQVCEFLQESNKIEGISDEDSFKQAKYAWEYCIKQDKLSIDVILKTHKILMLHQPLRPDEKGYFRQVPVYIGGHEALHYSQITTALYGWLKLMNSWATVRDWKKLHVMYEGIHPFVDGNGRSGRLFMNWQRIKAGMPILVLYALERQEYYKWFRE